MAYDNTNKGSLGKNKRKEKDTHPDYAGTINIDGIEFWLSGWIKVNKETAEKFFSLSVKRKEPRADVPAKTVSADDDDIPF